MEELTAALTAHVEFHSLPFFKIVLVAVAVCLGIGLLGRIFLGRRSDLNHAVTATVGILCLYILAVALYALELPYHFLLTTLPFVQVDGAQLVVFSFSTATVSATCSELLRLVMLAFLVNLLDSWLPEGKNVLTWYLLRFATIALALVLQYGLAWLFATYLPNAMTTYAPAILVVVLAASMLMGVLKLILGLFLATINPVVAAFYAFFFSNSFGKQISKAVFTTVLLTGFVYGLNVLGYTAISMTSAALLAFLPVILVLLVLWYGVRKLL